MKKTSILALISLIVMMNSYSQKSTDKPNRKPVVAGKFYPARKHALEQNLADLFAAAPSKQTENTLAVIAPHAGYVFSGEVAAASFNQIDADKEYDNIFILASSHRATYKGGSIYNQGNYETPLGEIKVNIPLADKLISENGLFDYHPSAHSGEHSLEVQLPFLQYKLKNDFQIVPIVIGTHDKEECKKMAETLKPYFNKNNLFVISSDFSHYPHYEAAKEVDQITANAITSNSPQSLVETLASNSQKGIANLATSLCGWSSVLTLMNMTSGMDSINYHQVLYKNSGDAGITDRSQVVGYYAIAVSLGEEEESSGFHLSEQDKTQLLTIARKTISSYITLGKIPEFKPDQFSPKLLTKCGAFVTLHKGGELRGCIGQFTPSKPLYMVIRENAISASTKDTRFFPVQPDEVDELEIEVSVLTPLKKIESIDEFKLGKHGIYIKNGKRSGTLLPQVAQSTGWSLEEFLGHCAKDKAGLAWDGWKDSDLYTYEAIIFKESDFTE